jgi:hypothetical protein
MPTAAIQARSPRPVSPPALHPQPEPLLTSLLDTVLVCLGRWLHRVPA